MIVTAASQSATLLSVTVNIYICLYSLRDALHCIALQPNTTLLDCTLYPMQYPDVSYIYLRGIVPLVYI